MSLDLEAVRTGIVTALTALGNDIGGQVVPYVPAAFHPPIIWFEPDETTYDLAGSRGLDEWTWIIHAVVSANITAEGAQRILDGLLAPSGSTSIKQAMEADRTLGGTVDDVRVVNAKGYQVFDLPAIGVALGSTWEARVLAES